MFFYTQQIINNIPDVLLNSKQTNDLLTAALLHDLGKSTWSKEWFILPRYQITEHDWGIMQVHPVQSISIVKDKGLYVSDNAKKLILEHHQHKNSKEVPFINAILISADIYSACTEPREYRDKPLTQKKSLEEVGKVAPDIIVSALKH